MDARRIWCLGCCAFLLASARGWPDAPDQLSISTPAFGKGMPMSAKFAYKGQNISPEIRIGSVPANAQTLVLIVDDPDSPTGLWTHWLVWNLPPNTKIIPEGKLSPNPMQGKNSFGHVRYDGPAPPSGTHRYFFHLSALDTTLSLPPGSDRTALLAAMQGHVVGTGETFATYSARDEF